MPWIRKVAAITFALLLTGPAFSVLADEKPWGDVVLVPWEEDAPGPVSEDKQAEQGAEGQPMPPLQTPEAEPMTEDAPQTIERPWYYFPIDEYLAKHWNRLFGDDGGTAFEAELLGQAARLVREERYEEALDVYGAAIKAYPDNPVTINNLGIVLGRLGKDDQALEAYQFCVDLAPEFALGYKNMALLHDRNGNREAAVRAYRSYVRLAPKAHDAAVVRERADWLESRTQP